MDKRKLAKEAWDYIRELEKKGHDVPKYWEMPTEDLINWYLMDKEKEENNDKGTWFYETHGKYRGN